MAKDLHNAECLMQLGLDLATVAARGHTLSAGELARLGLHLAKTGSLLRRMQRSLDEVVANAAEEEQLTARRERFQPTIAAIVAGVATFQEPNHITERDDGA